MAISEDLKSIQIALRAMPGLSVDSLPLIRLMCNNLQSIAEQVESLENIPLATTDLLRQQPLKSCSNT